MKIKYILNMAVLDWLRFDLRIRNCVDDATVLAYQC